MGDKPNTQITEAPKLLVGVGMVKNASTMASILGGIIEKQKLYTTISNRKYVVVEGWTTLGAMIGVFPEVIDTLNDKSVKGEIRYLAKVQLKTMTGEIITTAQALCTSAEKNWKGRDEYAILSMAQTRATGKAFRLAFSWIIKMAGYEGTPAEEMSKDDIPTVESDPPSTDHGK